MPFPVFWPQPTPLITTAISSVIILSMIMRLLVISPSGGRYLIVELRRSMVSAIVMVRTSRIACGHSIGCILSGVYTR